MKHLDTFSQRILAVSLSLMGLTLCATLFLSTMTNANASEEDKNIFNTTSGAGTGTIMMNYTSVHVPSEDKTYYEVMVWDTETGYSRLYYYDYTEKKFTAYGENVQLPANPLR